MILQITNKATKETKGIYTWHARSSNVYTTNLSVTPQLIQYCTVTLRTSNEQISAFQKQPLL